MKTTKIFMMAALALTFAACSNDDNDFQTPAEQPAKAEGITITATLAPKTNGAATRAVADNGDNKITATWAADEHIAILYTVGSEKKVADAEITSVDGSGTATISFTVDGSTADGTACQIVYPLSAAKDDHSGVKDYADMLATQDGVLDSDLDVRVGAGTIQISTPGLTVSTQPAAQYSIFKFTLGSAIDDTHPLTIKDAADNVITNVKPTESKTAVYVALEPATSQYYKFSATTAENKIISKSSTATIAAGMFYQTELACPALGDLYYSDGTYSTTLQAGKTPIGVIAYLGNDATTEAISDGGGHGLVLCLKNAASEIAWSKEWVSKFSGQEVTNVDGLKRTENVSGYTNTATLTADAETAEKYPAAKAAKGYSTLAAPAGTTGWFLPSAQQWVKMQTGLGGLSESTITWGSWFGNSLTGANRWEAALAKAGTGNYDSMTPFLYYWSSSENSNGFAVYLSVSATDTETGYDYGFRWGVEQKDYTLGSLFVRPVLAF